MLDLHVQIAIGERDTRTVGIERQDRQLRRGRDANL